MRRRTYGGKDKHTLLLLHFDGDLKDSSMYNRQPITSAYIAYNTAKFDKGLKMSNYAASVAYPRQVFADLLNSVEYTIEFWVSITGNFWAPFCGIDDVTSDGFTFRINSNGTVLTFGKADNPFFRQSVSSIRNGMWHHLAAVKYNGVLTIYLNGVSIGSAPHPVLPIPNVNFTVGGRNISSADSGLLANSTLDEFRVSDIAIYTENFPPLTKPFK